MAVSNCDKSGLFSYLREPTVKHLRAHPCPSILLWDPILSPGGPDEVDPILWLQE